MYENHFAANWYDAAGTISWITKSVAVTGQRGSLLAEPKWFEQAKEGELADKIFQISLKVAGDVIHGYRFEDFDYVEVINKKDTATINVSREELEALRLKKIKFENIVNRL